jgi:FkbM family methyltransferase
MTHTHTHTAKSEPTSTFSLEGTDLILKSILRDVSFGRYLDIGANHPFLISNTYLFYQRGWRGVAVDGHHKFSNLWVEHRSKDIFLESIVSDAIKEVVFTIFPDDSMGSIDAETNNRYRARFDNSSVQSRTVITTTIFDIWKEHINDEVHLLSIDIEGEELNALKGANLNAFRPGVIAAEIKNVSLYSPLANKLVEFLTNSGYRLIAKTPLDCIFVDPQKDYLRWIPKELVKLTPPQP